MITLKKIIKNIKQEYNYYTRVPWTLTQVGSFWDSVEAYDNINSKLYPYYQRFLNSKKLFSEKYKKFNYNKSYKILDLQTRTGEGTLFWIKYFYKSYFTCVDFSTSLINKAKFKLKKNKNISFKIIKKENFLLKCKYDIILCYETIEHVFHYKIFISSLSKHLKKNGVMILTCPNISWEIVHWITAVLEYNHSEGPHRFIKLQELKNTFEENNLKIIRYNTTIFLPFNNYFSIKIDKLLKKIVPKKIQELIFLRHTFILEKK